MYRDEDEDVIEGRRLVLADPPGRDPSQLGWPPTLPIEVALRVAPIQRICEAYDLSKEDWNRLRTDPGFIAEVAVCVEALKKEGVSFKMKARLQSEALLKTSWNLIHNIETPANVKADMIKHTHRVAGYVDDGKSAGANVGAALQINISL